MPPPILHWPPPYTYKGLTIIMSNPSRFDRPGRILSANGGQFFDYCLTPAMSRHQCDIRLLNCNDPLREGTRCVLVLGEPAQKKYMGVSTTLNEQRGSPVILNGIPYISSYLPQECVDFRQLESSRNPYLTNTTSLGADSQYFGSIDGEDTEVPSDEKKHHGRTKHKNYSYWLNADVKKCQRICANPNVLHATPTTVYTIYPDANSVINWLSNVKGNKLFFDMETDANFNITCFAFGTDPSTVYVVPVIDHTYALAYEQTLLAQIFRSLAVAIRDNTIIAHNGSGFDYLILARNYKIPVGVNCCDTMLEHHRCATSVEKSLGHAISRWTYLPYHKDEGNFAYGNDRQAMQLWQYCGKDVSSMMHVHSGIHSHAATVPGLSESIDQTNASIRPYLISTLTGMSYSSEEMLLKIRDNDRYANAYMKLGRYLTGRERFLPTSPKDCVSYFHDQMDYPVLGKTPTGKPSLNEKIMLKLALAIKAKAKKDTGRDDTANPMIDLVLAYRGLIKESGSLGFVPWKE